MRLYLFRHGIAEPLDRAKGDASRRLTRRGMSRTTKAALGLAQIIDPPALIVTSPKRRAMETARVLGKVFGVRPQVLRPLGDNAPSRILKALASRPEESILAVGHEPTLTAIASLLLAGTPTAARLALKKAGCLCLQVEQGESGRLQGRLAWLTTPRMLRSLRR